MASGVQHVTWPTVTGADTTVEEESPKHTSSVHLLLEYKMCEVIYNEYIIMNNQSTTVYLDWLYSF